MTKLAIKLFRMKIISYIRDFIESLPVKYLVEKQVDDCVYAGDGVVITGVHEFPTSIQIIRDEAGTIVVINSPKAKVAANIPFNTESDRKKAPEEFKKLLVKYIN
jgi:hypothetical protein